MSTDTPAAPATSIMVQIGRLQQRATGVMDGTTARVEVGYPVHTSEGLKISPHPPGGPPQAGAAAPPPPTAYVLLGPAVLATFTAEERAEADELAAAVNGPLQSFRQAYEAQITERIRALVSPPAPAAAEAAQP
jgi:hypothetical protein